MTELKKMHCMMVTRTFCLQSNGEEGFLFHAFFNEKKNKWSVLYGFPSKNGERINYCYASSDKPSGVTTKYRKELITRIFLPENLDLARSAFGAVLHVLAGYDPDEFLGMPQYRRFSRKLGWIFKHELDKGRIPMEIYPSDEMILELHEDIMRTIDSSSLKTKRPSCVF